MLNSIKLLGHTIFFYTHIPYGSFLSLKVIALIVLCIAIISIVWTKRHSYITSDTIFTDQVRGIAILCIITFHYIVFDFTSNVFGASNSWGQAGVSAFLMLSGYGLMSSFLTHGIYKGYLKKRLLRILIPYWLVTFFLILVNITLQGTPYTFKTIAFAIFTIQLGNNPNPIDTVIWFVGYILFVYLVFYFVFSSKLKILKKIEAKITTLSLVLIFIPGWILPYLIHNANGDLNFLGFWNIYSFSFPIGILLAYYYKPLVAKLEKVQTLHRTLLFWIFLVICATVIAIQIVPDTLSPTVLTADSFHTAVLGIMLIAIAFALSLSNRSSIFLTFIGQIAFELYLVHYTFLHKYDFLLYRHVKYP